MISLYRNLVHRIIFNHPQKITVTDRKTRLGGLFKNLKQHHHHQAYHKPQGEIFIKRIQFLRTSKSSLKIQEPVQPEGLTVKGQGGELLHAAPSPWPARLSLRLVSTPKFGLGTVCTVNCGHLMVIIKTFSGNATKKAQITPAPGLYSYPQFVVLYQMLKFFSRRKYAGSDFF